MTTGGSCSARSTGSTRSRRRIYGGLRIKRLCPTTGRWGLSSLLAGLRDLVRHPKEVDSEARILLLLRPCSVPVYLFLQRQCATVGAGAELAADPDSEIARVSSAAAEAHRVAEWHGGFSSGRPRVADHRRHRSHSRRRALGSCEQNG